MPVTVNPVILWRKEIENKPGTLAVALEPLAMAGADLQVIMGYRFPGRPDAAALELFPVKGKKAVAAAQAAGLSESTIPTLLVEGDNKPGLGYAIAKMLAEARQVLERIGPLQEIGMRLSRIEAYAKESRLAVLADGRTLPVSRAGYERLAQLL